MPESMTWCFSLVLIFLGVAGLIIPVLPGLPLIYLGTALHKFEFFTVHPISWTTFWIITVIFVIAQIAELAAGFLGAASVGMNRWGFFGGVIGLMIGFFFSLPGLILGPLIGVFLGQLAGSRSANTAFRATMAFALGTVVGLAVKGAAAVAMIGALVVALVV